MQTRDHHAYQDLLARSEIRVIPAGTEVKVLQVQAPAGYFVRVLSGEQDGQTGWVTVDQFHHLGPDTRPFPPSGEEAPRTTAGDAQERDRVKLDTLLERALARQASELHVIIGLPPLLRIESRLQKIEEIPPLTPEAVRRMIFGIIADEQRQRLQARAAVDFSYALGDRARFRARISPDAPGGITAVFVREGDQPPAEEEDASS